ncbi:hypothetical protein COO60DRAFT_841003 [Scenedesmus sp. NREL 46B-D3]|nr:hypothetical protein COO60DRAFT_841003 [Scenedesmus sp. NREL 46B-D3]
MSYVANPCSVRTCCKQRTCGNMQPVTNPNNVRFSCITPAGDLVFDSDAVMVTPPSVDACCKPATCGDSNPRTPGQPFNCLQFGMFYNMSSADLPASEDNCCTDRLISPQNKADISLNKTVSPAFEGNNQNSSTLLVGSRFRFRIRVEVQGERNSFAENVVMTDNLPPGLQFVSLREQPNDQACTVAGKMITCRWDRINGLENNVKIITIITKALVAGVHVNPAQVTTITQDVNPDNNFDTSTANVKGACCRRGVCTEVLPAACPQPSEVDLANGCATTITTCGRSPIEGVVGACCISTNDVATCIDRVPQSACTGTWSSGASCTNTTCRSPTGACCEVPSGRCTDGLTRSQCPNRHSWMRNGRCGRNGWCVGGCCNEAASNCTEMTAARCRSPGKWSLYSKCDKEYCPVEPPCVPSWWSCKPSDKDPCCPGYACLPTYTGCEVGPYVCKPKAPVCESNQCGGKHGTCCSGRGCFWDHKKKKGSCWKHSSSKCGRPGAQCTADTNCCVGHRCINGACQKVTKARCTRKCKSYACFQDRQRDCNCLYAAAASNSRLAVP